MRPKVSIVAISYNQEKYISEALESFITQKTNFDFEVVIADDASSDQTQNIINTYTSRYPDLFRPILRKNNIGVQRNLIDALSRAKGEYIALCEGDDYWTDSSKLQRQVDFLEKHPKYSLCFHPVRVFFENNKEKETIFPGTLHDFTTSNLLKQNYIQTNSVMYRAQEGYKKLSPKVMPFDWYLHLYHANSGKIGFINRVMSAYRRHEDGVWWSSTNQNKQEFWTKHGLGYIALFSELLNIFGKKDQKSIILENTRNCFKQMLSHNPVVAQNSIVQYPELGLTIIKSLIEENNMLSQTLEQKNQENIITEENLQLIMHEIELIKRSKIWRLRNRVARYINRGSI